MARRISSYSSHATPYLHNRASLPEPLVVVLSVDKVQLHYFLSTNSLFSCISLDNFRLPRSSVCPQCIVCNKNVFSDLFLHLPSWISFSPFALQPDSFVSSRSSENLSARPSGKRNSALPPLSAASVLRFEPCGSDRRRCDKPLTCGLAGFEASQLVRTAQH